MLKISTGRLVTPIALAIAVAVVAHAAPGEAASREGKPAAAASPPFDAADVFSLAYASDPQIAPDGRRVAYLRVAMDVRADRRMTTLRVIDTDGRRDTAVPGVPADASEPRWSPDGRRLLFRAPIGGLAQLFVWTVGDAAAQAVTALRTGASAGRWSPDGRRIAFATRIPKPAPTLFTMPPRPADADWAPSAEIAVEDFKAYDVGEIEPTIGQILVVPASGGTPAVVASGAADYGDIAWTADGRALLASGLADVSERRFAPKRALFRIDVVTGSIERLATIAGTSTAPIQSVDGKLAFLGTTKSSLAAELSLYVADRPGAAPRALAAQLDHDIRAAIWSRDSATIYILYADRGQFRVGRVDLGGRLTPVAEDVGPSDIGRPQAKAPSFSVADDGSVAFVRTNTLMPGDIAVARAGKSKRLTDLNGALLASRSFGRIDEIDFKSDHDGLPIQSWLIEPAAIDKRHRCPLVLLIHGGPWGTFTGRYFSAEAQIYAGAGYCVLSVNYRGSGSYGQSFSDTTVQAFPGRDFDDLMSGVDAAIATGIVDPNNLFVAGGSAGGVLTAWIVGHSTRFRAAVAQKSYVDLASFALTTDNPLIYKLFADKLPWEDPTRYRALSPLNYMDRIVTPTMVLDGTNDVRTPTAQSEAFYNALRLHGVPTMLVRLPGAGHEYSNRPSQLIAGALATLGWFERYRKPVRMK